MALDVSVPQIGAPEVWRAGYDGTGVKVTVLDTGVDAGHPDLAGKVLDARSFVPGESVADGHGHGTHVASTIVGSGAASGGKRKGVAPAAELLVGKVADNTGYAQTSWMIAGMEWRVRDSDAELRQVRGHRHRGRPEHGRRDRPGERQRHRASHGRPRAGDAGPARGPRHRDRRRHRCHDRRGLREVARDGRSEGEPRRPRRQGGAVRALHAHGAERRDRQRVRLRDQRLDP
ncbi:S8 family peptidase [Streptomyces sp. NBC_01390]|uniref:S8 family peptidase n=1 Tax=Streptomyces sp. NBC_01390 TaxID=2903850 RepID=UPI00386EFC66